MITGTITDKATGLPLEGVIVSIGSSDYQVNDYDVLVEKSHGSDKDTTDQNGFYAIELEVRRRDGFGWSARKEGYLHKFGDPVRWGKNNRVDFEMNPVDAFLEVIVVNESGYLGNTYCLTEGASEGFGGYFYPWPFIVPKDSLMRKTFMIPGDQFVKIVWGDEANQVLWEVHNIHIDSVFCPRRDTSQYLLKL